VDDRESRLIHLIRLIPGAIVTLAFLEVGVGLWLQPTRWSATPSYGNLLRVAGTDVWGTAYLVAAGLLLTYLAGARGKWWFALIAHFASFALSLSWLVAFIIRWATDPHTTIANVASWSTYTLLIVASALLIDAART
jgi:hypothetical protein